MGELEAGTVLRTTDGSLARVVGSERRQGSFEVFNFEVEDAHNYYVSSPRGSPGVLVHNTCFRGMDSAPNWRSKPNWGHTFNRHGAGSKKTNKLVGRAASENEPQGQWLNNDAAAEHIFEQAQSLDLTGPTYISIPDGLGQVVMPGGSIVSTTRAIVVPNGRGTVRSAYPIPDN